jgi:hypothetical protein
MVELRDAVTRMCGYLEQKTPAGHWMGKRCHVSKHILSIVSLHASLLLSDAQLRRDEESNQKHFQLTAFISQSTIHLHFEWWIPVAAHPQKSCTCQTWEIRSQITDCQQTPQHAHSLPVVADSPLSMFMISFPFSIIRLITFFTSGIQNMFQ